MKLFYIIAAAVMTSSLFAVELKDSPKLKTVSNKYYTITIDNVKGALKTLNVGKKKLYHLRLSGIPQKRGTEKV